MVNGQGKITGYTQVRQTCSCT